MSYDEACEWMRRRGGVGFLSSPNLKYEIINGEHATFTLQTLDQQRKKRIVSGVNGEELNANRKLRDARRRERQEQQRRSTRQEDGRKRTSGSEKERRKTKAIVIRVKEDRK